MTTKEVLAKLKSLGSDSGKRIYINHGAVGTCYGVKIADLKLVHKQIKNDQQLAMELYDTGVLDAMYLAGLVADGSKNDEKTIAVMGRKSQLAHDQRIYRGLGGI